MHPYDARLLQEIIKKQIEQHANYSLKTEYSKEKYKKRKEMKCVLVRPRRLRAD